MNTLRAARRSLTSERAGLPVWVIVLAITAIVVVGVLVALRSAVAAPSTAYRPPAAAAAAASPSVTDPLPAHPRVLVFGDSYTYGTASTPLTSGYAYLVAKELGGPSRVDGVGGTGYVNGGPYPTPVPYGKRIAQFIAKGGFTPDLVILEGSQNDWASTAKIRVAADAVVRQLHVAYPRARIVLFGPAAPQPAMNTLQNIDREVAAAAYDMDVPYISPFEEGWFTTANSKIYGAADGAHLNTAGHRYLADRLLQDLNPLIVS